MSWTARVLGGAMLGILLQALVAFGQERPADAPDPASALTTSPGGVPQLPPFAVEVESAQPLKGVQLTPSGQWFCCAPPSKGDELLWLGGRRKGPNSVGASVRVGSPASFVSVGVVGTRDYRLPLFMSTLLAGSEIPPPALASMTDLSRGIMTWQVVGSARRQLFEGQNGVTVGVAADVFIPVNGDAQIPRGPVLSSRAIRFGVTVGF